jgi:tetratricopeptide (TPR) repeat protein
MFMAVKADEHDFNGQQQVINVGAKAAPSSGSPGAIDQKVQAQAESQTVPGDAALSKAEQYYRYGEKLFTAGDYMNALKYFYTVTKMDIKNVKAWKKVAFCYYKLQKHNYAYSAFKMVLKYAATDKDALEFMDYYKTIIDKNTKVRVKREPIDSIWRAAVFPGFGQVYNNQTAKGIIFGSAFIAAAGLCVYNVSDEKVKYDKYKIANENQDIAFKQAQDSWTSALVFGILAGAVYAGSILDAGLSYNCDDAQTAGLEIKDNTVYLAASCRW